VHFLYSVLGIILIDVVLSGDNAVVIGMAAHRLPSHQRKIAIVIGGAAAIVLRIVLTYVALRLLQISGLKLAGGLLLIWIAFNLLKKEEESAEGVKVANSMGGAILTILVADLVMSTDNVLGVAAASHGSATLLLFGLILSMAILLWMGNMVAGMINRFAWLSYLGAAVIVWTGAMMIVEDPIIYQRAAWISRPLAYLFAAVSTALVTALAHWFHRVRPGEAE
jgi:YjbE family integral membrane protein